MTADQPHLADGVDHERLAGRAAAAGPLVPKADEQVGSQADVGPADEHADEIVGQHQHAHGEDEEVQFGEKACKPGSSAM